MDNPSQRLSFANDEAKINAVTAAIAHGPKATTEEREMMGLSPEAHLEPRRITPLNDMMRAAMLTTRTRRRHHAQMVEEHCDGDPEIIAAIRGFMSNVADRMADTRREFMQIMEALANTPGEDAADFPEPRWQKGIHRSFIQELVNRREDVAVDLCVASWNCTLLPAQDVQAYQLQNARIAVTYGKAEEIARNTSRAVCRMEIKSRLSFDPMRMIALRQQFQNRADNIPGHEGSTPNAMAQRIVANIALNRLEEAINRPESENPKDGILASYCQEIHENLPK